MRKFSFAIGAVMLLAGACAKQPSEEPFQPLVLSAVQEGVTKTSLSGKSVHWSAGDQVAAFVNDVAHNSTSAEILSATSARFTFSDLEAGATVQYAVYPASAVVGPYAGGATVTVPSEQTAKADSFDEGAAVAIAGGAASPMVFRNICGFLAFTFEDTDAASVASIRIIANEPMTGQADVDWNGGKNPTVAPSTTKSLNGVKLSGTFQSGKTYYVAVFPHTSYTGLTIKITRNNGYVTTYTNSTPLTLARKGNIVIASGLSLKAVPASGNWAEKDPAYIGSTETVIPVGKVGSDYQLISNEDTKQSGSPAAYSIANVESASLTSVGEDYRWHLSYSEGKFQLFPANTNARWLNCETTADSGSQTCMAVNNDGSFNRKYFIWDAAGHVLTSDSYAARYLSYSSGVWYGETYPASASYPAAMFSFYVYVPVP